VRGGPRGGNFACSLHVGFLSCFFLYCGLCCEVASCITSAGGLDLAWTAPARACRRCARGDSIQGGFRGGRLVQRDDLYISTTNNRLFGTHLHMPNGACGCHWLSRGLLVSEWHAHSHLDRRGAKDAHTERRAAILRRHPMTCARFTGPRSIISALTCDCKAIILPSGAAQH
jgi:hypothetical protein